MSVSVMVALRPLVAVVLLAGLCGCQVNLCFDQGTQSALPSTAYNFSGVDRFGLKLFTQLVPLVGADQNLLMSPYSVWSVLSLALMGAQGSTREQLQNALNLPSTKMGVYFFKNAVDFVLNGVASGVAGGPELRRVDRAYFDQSLPLRQCVFNAVANVERLDFSNPATASERINSDVSRGTGGQIPDLLTPNSLVNAFFVLINAIYFKGDWLNKFNVQDTNKQVFYNAQGGQVANADMMTQQGQFNIVSSPALGATMLELPYDKSNMSMFVLLPDIQNPRVDGVMAALNPYTLEQAISASQKLPIRVFLPKFDIKTEVESELVQALQNVGISHMFDGSKANFSDFTGNTPLFADTAIHQAKVKVDEVGTIAAAATAIIGTRSGPGQVVQFIANRPFVFLIYEKKIKITLFAGVVRDPTK